MFHTSEIPAVYLMCIACITIYGHVCTTGIYIFVPKCPKHTSIVVQKLLAEELQGFGFPLPEETGPYLCTQGVGGHLTHFFPVTWRYDTQLFDCLRM